jgi:L-lysine 2,3-aminomutase
MEGLKFAAKEAELLVNYLKVCPQVTDVLITGGDPLVMSTERLKCYIEALIQADLPGLQTIRIGTKALSYWPYRFTTDKDSRELLDLFRRVQAAGKHLAFMAHFNHPKELKTDAVKEAIARVRETGAVIRTQSPLMKNINDSSALWHEMWSEQVRLGMVPYYMFLARDTGAQHYFAVSLAKALDIFNQAYRALTGLARTVRGPCMSVKSGKVLVNGVAELANEKVFVLNFIQGRNGNWAQTPFFAKYDEKAIWLNDLEPAFGKEKFFFEDEATEIDACFLAEEALS